jgi:hypothetical protein
MLYREIIAICSQIHTKHINTVCGQNVEFVNVSYHWPLKIYVCTWKCSRFGYLERPRTRWMSSLTAVKECLKARSLGCIAASCMGR